jgi:hypothetical protein
MRFKILFVFLILLTVSFDNCHCLDSTITNGQSIAANGSSGAWLIDSDGNVYKFDTTTNKFQLFTISAPNMKQIDSKSNGSNVVGIDSSGIAKIWNGVFGFGSVWSDSRGSTQYDWVLIDPVTQETRGQVTGLGGAWESWDVPTLGVGDPWNKFLPAGLAGSNKIKDLFLVDKDAAFTRWERGDTNYFVQLNLEGLSPNPFFIYYYGDDSDAALGRITDPPVLTKNIDDVMVSQISYDDEFQNLWCVDSGGSPWQWDNVGQEWIQRNIKGDEGFQLPGDRYQDVIDLLRIQNDFYIRTRYIDGVHTPRLIIFKDSYIMHLILGERSRSNFDNEIDIVIFEASKKEKTGFHNILRLPKETPQKKVRIDSTNRIRENHYLERLLISRNIIANADAINVFPAQHRIVRR